MIPATSAPVDQSASRLSQADALFGGQVRLPTLDGSIRGAPANGATYEVHHPEKAVKPPKLPKLKAASGSKTANPKRHRHGVIHAVLNEATAQPGKRLG